MPLSLGRKKWWQWRDNSLVSVKAGKARKNTREESPLTHHLSLYPRPPTIFPSCFLVCLYRLRSWLLKVSLLTFKVARKLWSIPKYNFCQHNLMKGMIVYLFIKKCACQGCKSQVFIFGSRNWLTSMSWFEIEVSDLHCRGVNHVHWKKVDGNKLRTVSGKLRANEFECIR